MTTVPVPIFTPVYKNIDKSMNNDQNYRVMDAYLDEAGGTNPRPGLLSAVTLSPAVASFVAGLYWWDAKEKLMAVCGSRLWSISSAYAGTDITTAGTVIAPGVRPTFATEGSTLFIATGGKIIQTDGVTTLLMADADAPILVTHIAIVDNYLVAINAGDDKFYFSGLETPTVWSALDFAQAGSDPDNTVAFHVFRKELYFFGKKSLEIWQNDGQSPFSRVEGGFLETGCGAPYSVVNTDTHIMWLSDKGRFVKYNGGGIEHVSTPYDKEIDTFLTISDCTVDRIDIVGREFYAFNFPSEGRTLVYNETDDNWTEWGKWVPGSYDYEIWKGACYAFSPTWRKHFVGSVDTEGKIYFMSPDYLDDDGTKIRTSRITGHVTFGSNNRKRSNHLTFRAKRGETAGSGEPVMMLRVKNDNKSWSNERQISLGKKGETRNIIKLNRLGMFRSRQYEFSCTDAIGLTFSDAQEDIYVGPN